jgi:hypothetical protein
VKELGERVDRDFVTGENRSEVEPEAVCISVIQ